MVGGGAAGYFSAVNIAEKNPRARITIFEAGRQPLQKVRISGGGRCNVTHACFDSLQLTEFYPRGSKELRSLFARFQPKDTIAWFEKRGLKLKTEGDNRIFPVSDDSEDVIGLLMHEADRQDVRLKRQARVERIEYRDNLFYLTSLGETQLFDVCILATGYSPPGWQLAESLGHSVIPPVPSLFPFTVKSPVLADLQGISVAQACGKLLISQNGKPAKIQAEGPLLITHTGLSGPLIYRLSAWGARALAASRYQAQIQLDLLPETSEEALRLQLEAMFRQTDAKKKTGNTQMPPLSHRLWLSLLQYSDIDLEARGETLNQKSINRLIENLKRLTLPVTGKSPSKEEFVSCGGVPLKEIDFKTLESKKIPGLYFAGEIMDIDALTGGFNFQACWSAGWTISEAIRS